MASPSAPCRECDRGSYRCDGCRQLFCEYHFSEHRQYLTQQFDNLTTEYSDLQKILALPPSYQSLTENTELIDKINQWEIDIIRQVKEIAEATREKIRHRSDTIATERFGPEFQQLTEELQQRQRTNHLYELDIEQLTTKLNNFKLQVEESLLTTAEIRTIPIDWTKYIQIVMKQNRVQRNQRNIHIDRLLTIKPRISLDVRGADWHVLGTTSSSNSIFLHYQHTRKNKRLSVVNVNGQQKQIPWYEDQSIWDSCWSSFLNKFIILADNRLYTYDNNIVTSDSMQLIEAVKPKRDKMEFLRCICSDETIFITYDERNSSIDEYNMSHWTVVHRYENIVKQNEIIVGIAMSEINSNLIGITVLDDKQHWHFELRDRSMLLISSIQLDKSEFNRRIISLSNSSMNWLIVHTGTIFFTVLDETAQTKRTIECAEPIDLATYFAPQNCLVVLTQKSKLKFFDL
ncbi:unnamed protein product [Rotaria sordida]|uniref:Uncharacterized protein n=1 Tax=Rotaria sordida TaxID=392033 RepID=A0A818IPB2_9BILA|nr:unnamed protein product [Rotaria sordida]CAF3526812.1 unnamed protein product [Rotaria sordida]